MRAQQRGGDLPDEAQGQVDVALKWYNILITRVPSDPGVLLRMGQLCNRNDDEAQAFHFHLESYRHYPVSLDVISWLGVWYVKSEMYEKAIHFFERAAQIQPKEVKWRLMVTSCYRRMGNYQRALELYEKVHAEHPENAECLRYLVAICKDLGQPCDHYQAKLSGWTSARNRRSSPKGNSQGRRPKETGHRRDRILPKRQRHHLNNSIWPLPKLEASPTRTRSGRGRPLKDRTRTNLMMRTWAEMGGSPLPRGMCRLSGKRLLRRNHNEAGLLTFCHKPRRGPSSARGVQTSRVGRRGQNIRRIDAGRYTSLDARGARSASRVQLGMAGIRRTWSRNSDERGPSPVASSRASALGYRRRSSKIKADSPRPLSPTASHPNRGAAPARRSSTPCALS